MSFLNPDSIWRGGVVLMLNVLHTELPRFGGKCSGPWNVTSVAALE